MLSGLLNYDIMFNTVNFKLYYSYILREGPNTDDMISWLKIDITNIEYTIEFN